MRVALTVRRILSRHPVIPLLGISFKKRKSSGLFSNRVISMQHWYQWSMLDDESLWAVHRHPRLNYYRLLGRYSQMGKYNISQCASLKWERLVMSPASVDTLSICMLLWLSAGNNLPWKEIHCQSVFVNSTNRSLRYTKKNVTGDLISVNEITGRGIY